MFRAHALTNARSNLVAGRSGTEKISAAHSRPKFCHRQQGWQCHRANMQYAVAIGVSEFEVI
jgi:hypothetical protein